jgi:hypothetical protein
MQYQYKTIKYKQLIFIISKKINKLLPKPCYLLLAKAQSRKQTLFIIFLYFYCALNEQ